MLLGADIHNFTDHKNLTFDTLKMQRALCWHAKIEEFSPMIHYFKGPCNILADILSRLHCLVTLAQIVEGKRLVEPAEVSNKEKRKCIHWFKNTLVFMTMTFGNVFSVISTYLKLHIRMRIHRIVLTFVPCSSRTNNCLLYKQNILTTMSTYNRMMMSLTSSVIRKIPLNPIGNLQCLNQW